MKNQNLLVGGLVIAVLIGIGLYSIGTSNTNQLQGSFSAAKTNGFELDSDRSEPDITLSPAASSSATTCEGLVLEIDGSSESISDGSMSDLYAAVENGCEVQVVATSSSTVDQHIAFTCTDIELGETTSGQDFVDCTGAAYLSYDGSELMSKNFGYTVDADGSTDLVLDELTYDASGEDTSSWSTTIRTFSIYAR